MNAASESELNVEAAKRLWVEYQQTHDLSGLSGQIAGIEPVSGQIWFGEWITDVVSQRDAANIERPLFFERVGSRTCFRKGGRR